MSTWKMAALAILICAMGCKKDEANRDEVGEKLAEVLTIQSEAAAVYAENYSGPQDSVDALDATGQWLVAQDGVEEAFYVGISCIEVVFKNGLRSSILLTEADQDGQHLTRGGGYGSALTAYKSTAARKKIKNEKVLVLNPFVDQFYNGNYNKKTQFKLDGQQMEVDIYNGADVTFGVLNTMGGYGLTIINTHGLTYGFMLFKLFDEPQNPERKNWSKTEALALLDQSGGADLDKIANGEVELSLNIENGSLAGSIKQYIVMVVTTKYLDNSGLDLTDAVVFGNFCYSGYTYDGPGYHNVPAAFRRRNAAAYYGYAFETGFSKPVDNDFAKRMEDSLIANLANVADTTGVAHLAANTTKQFYKVLVPQSQRQKVVRGVRLQMVTGPNPNLFPFYFTQFFETNYTYKDCKDTLLDVRDNQVYQVVCIGNRVWMAENLNFAAPGSICYDSLATNCDIYGRLYSRDEVFNGQMPQTLDTATVKGICPQGWHIPSAADWADLEIALGVSPSEANNLALSSHGESVEAGSKLMSSTGWKSYSGTDGPSADSMNLSGFSALPGGSWDASFDPFSPAGELAYFWSSTNTPNDSTVMLRRLRYRFRGIYISNDRVLSPTVVTRNSCRCVQD